MFFSLYPTHAENVLEIHPPLIDLHPSLKVGLDPESQTRPKVSHNKLFFKLVLKKKSLQAKCNV